MAPESSHNAGNLFVEQLPDTLDIDKIKMGVNMTTDEGKLKIETDGTVAYQNMRRTSHHQQQIIEEGNQKRR